MHQKKIGFIALFVIIIDQITKLLIKNYIDLNSSVILIKNFFNLTYVRNIGAAWSILSGSRFLLILIALIVLLCIYFFLIKGEKLKKLEIVYYGMLIGGIIGNLIDRIIFGYVIDYLDFYIFEYNFPVFNLADSFIVISVILMIIDIVFSIKRGDMDAKNKS